MKSQAEVLRFSSIGTDDMPGYRFQQQDLDFLVEAERIIFDEWSKVAANLGLCATLAEIPVSYDKLLKIQGKWNLDYATPKDIEG